MGAHGKLEFRPALRFLNQELCFAASSAAAWGQWRCWNSWAIMPWGAPKPDMAHENCILLLPGMSDHFFFKFSLLELVNNRLCLSRLYTQVSKPAVRWKIYWFFLNCSLLLHSCSSAMLTALTTPSPSALISFNLPKIHHHQTPRVPHFVWGSETTLVVKKKLVLNCFVSFPA